MPNLTYYLFVLASRLFFVYAQPLCYFPNNRLINVEKSTLLCYNSANLCSTTAELSRDSHNNFIFRRYPKR